jgi:GDP-D-mannose dehydratase
MVAPKPSQRNWHGFIDNRTECLFAMMFFTNHESPRRGENFVTRKIARGAARIARNRDDNLVLGNLESRRDWGRAQDYVQAMWLMLQHETAEIM